MLVGRRVGQRVALHRLLVERRRPGAWTTKAIGLWPFSSSGTGHDGGLMDAGMALQHLLDLAGIDVLAAAHEHVVGAADEVEEAVLVAAEHVAGAVVAVRRHRLGRDLGQLVIVRHQRAALHLQHALVVVLDDLAVAHQAQLDLGMRVAGRQLGLRDALGMRAEHHGPGLGRAVAVADRGLGKVARTWSISAWVMGAEPMRTASTAERSLLARSSRSRSIMAIMVGTEVRKATRWRRGGLDVALGGELRQQDDGVALVQRRLAHGQTVHVIERRRDQRALAVRHRPAHPLADRPEMRIVRQHHALRPAGRARRVEEHRRFLGLHLEAA